MADYQYPFSDAPEIIRSNQKDAYFQAILLEQLSDIARRLYGARFIHNHALELKIFAGLVYHGLTTFIGIQTLGEEYCDIVQVEHYTRRLPSPTRRAGYILSTLILPYGLHRILPAFRRRVKALVERSLRNRANKPESSSSQWTIPIKLYIISNLDTITSPALFYAFSLATFYFSGAYYHLGKRLWGLRYIRMRQVDVSDHKVGYEMLGVLLLLQLSVQFYTHVYSTLAHQPPSFMHSASLAEGSLLAGGGVRVGLDPQAYTSNNHLLLETGGPQAPDTEQVKLARMTNTPIAPGYRYHLVDQEVMQWMPSSQQRKCTLCLEEFKDPSVTTCGHVFCWICIRDWLKERPECPLCRSQVLSQHVLPLRG